MRGAYPNLYCSLWVRTLQTSFWQVFGQNPVFLNRTADAKSWIPAQKHRRNDEPDDRPPSGQTGYAPVMSDE
jgi:hypothetical protein